MSAELARQRYLQRHIEPGLPDSPTRSEPWHNVLVVPAYDESSSLLENLAKLPTDKGTALVILVLNRPQGNPDDNANQLLRDAVKNLAPGKPATPGLYRLHAQADLYLYDLEQQAGPTPAAQGVGLARKLGCDIAFKWMSQGAISGRWIYSSDADALLPPDYFSRLEACPPGAVAATYPFWHTPGPDDACNRATGLYELRLHHYVLGLEYANSPYAMHSLGSCLAVSHDGYAMVRGFPKRAGAEDFYLLGKLAKIGPIARLQGQCIALQSRYSNRVPFGTGPAVATISAAAEPARLALFYHPASFEALRALLATAPALQQTPTENLPRLLKEQGLDSKLANACHSILADMGLAAALKHCRRQGKAPAQFMRQFHQWFDAFRSLKFIHAIRDAGWADQSLAGLRELSPDLWGGADTNDNDSEVDALRRQIIRNRGWIH